MTVPAWHAVVSLDISDPAAPREVSRVSLGAGSTPHWVALSPDRRIVLTGSDSLEHRVTLLRFDPRPARWRSTTAFARRGIRKPASHGQQDVAARGIGKGHPARRRLQPPLVFSRAG